jgi:hypothetical protein
MQNKEMCGNIDREITQIAASMSREERKQLLAFMKEVIANAKNSRGSGRKDIH